MSSEETVASGVHDHTMRTPHKTSPDFESHKSSLLRCAGEWTP